MLDKDISSSFTIQTGLKLYIFRYEFQDNTTQATGPNREPNGNYIEFTMAEGFHTSYLLIPIQAHYSPFIELPLYFIAGPEISYKIGYSNCQIKFYTSL